MYSLISFSYIYGEVNVLLSNRRRAYGFLSVRSSSIPMYPIVSCPSHCLSIRKAYVPVFLEAFEYTFNLLIHPLLTSSFFVNHYLIELRQKFHPYSIFFILIHLRGQPFHASQIIHRYGYHSMKSLICLSYFSKSTPTAKAPSLHVAGLSVCFFSDVLISFRPNDSFHDSITKAE